MKLKAILAYTMIGVMLISGFVGYGKALTSPTLGINDSNGLARSRMQSLITYYFDQPTIKTGTSGILNRGYGDSAAFSYNIPYEENTVSVADNVMGVLTFEKDFYSTGNTKSQSWAASDIWNGTIEGELINVDSHASVVHSQKFAVAAQGRYMSVDQFMFLEFIGQAAILSGDTDMQAKCENLYDDFASQNYTATTAAPYGAYWTTVQTGAQYYNPGDTNEIMPWNDQYPLTNTSLWAAAGLASFEVAVKGTHEDQVSNYANRSLSQAIASMAFADTYMWDPFLGLYWESPNIGYISANTQIVGLLACARLYEATGDQAYLIKANTILDSIMKYFWIPSFGGVQQLYDPLSDFANGVITGYDNALLAYALFQLAIATGASDMNFEQFVLGKPDNQYEDLAMSVMAFMNNYLWLVNPGVVQGYGEYFDLNLTSFTPIMYNSTFSNIRLATTNLLAYYNLAETVSLSAPWYVYYELYLIYCGVGLGVLILVIVLVVHRRNKGTSLPKVVKGLLGGED